MRQRQTAKTAHARAKRPGNAPEKIHGVRKPSTPIRGLCSPETAVALATELLAAAAAVATELLAAK